MGDELGVRGQVREARHAERVGEAEALEGFEEGVKTGPLPPSSVPSFGSSSSISLTTWGEGYRRAKLCHRRDGQA